MLSWSFSANHANKCGHGSLVTMVTLLAPCRQWPDASHCKCIPRVADIQNESKLGGKERSLSLCLLRDLVWWLCSELCSHSTGRVCFKVLFFENGHICKNYEDL